MHLAITGGTGFVGQALLDEALAAGHTLRALTRREQAPRSNIEWVLGDLANKDALARLVEGAQAVLHIAGVVSSPTRAGFVEGNVEGTRRITDAARNSGGNRLILVSSLAAREPELSDYGRTKRDGERLVEQSGLDWTIVRPPAVYGPRDTEVFQLFRVGQWGVVPVPSAGRMSLLHVTDLARLLLALLPSGRDVSSRIFEPDDGKLGGWAHREFARAIGRAVGRNVLTPGIPPRFFTATARLDQLIRGDKAKLTADRARYMVHPDWVSSPELRVPNKRWKAQIEGMQGLRETAAWYRQERWL